MWPVVGFFLATLCQLASAQPPTVRGLPSIYELAESSGVQITPILVTTDDGYKLWMLRLGNNTGHPVILQHGIVAAPDSWITRGPKHDLAYLLVEEGYDVYLGTVKGSAYNEFHIKYKRNDPRFWKFSFHEMGLYDIPAMIDKVLELTGEQKISYIGHSLGTTVFLVMASSRPEYNEKVAVAILLSPVAFAPRLSEFSPTLFRFAVKNRKAIYNAFFKAGTFEFLPRRETNVKFIQKFCGPSPSQDYCLDLYGSSFGENRININREKFGYRLSFGPAGTSLYTVAHFGQVYETSEFREYDYEVENNLVIYNSTEPPNYRLDRVTSPVAIFWGVNDQLLSEWSVKKLVSHLPNVILDKIVPDPKFSHLDAIFGENAKEVLYEDIITLLKSA